MHLALALALLREGHGSGGPGKPIKKLSPFVRDTVFPAAGGPSPITRSGFPPIGQPNWLASTSMTPSDTSSTLYARMPGAPAVSDDHLIAHELGHVADARHVAWQPMMEATARMGEYRGGQDYFGSDPNEYAAEAFARALESGRRGFADSTEVDRRMPGTIALIRWLQTRPPFKVPTADSASVAAGLRQLPTQKPEPR